MEETPFYKKPWFYIVFWLAILLIAYGWQISRMGGLRANLFEVFFDLACIFPVLLILWMAFFAQFVLPVRTFRDRQKIFSRLFANFFGIHGPAIFIRNGELVKREGEERKKGAGVLWLDSASAAVTRTPVMIKQTIGPGVHFIENGEYVDKASILDLHIQSQMLGPDGEEDPFEKKKESQTDEEFTQIQKRREKVSALTRDGIEVIPNISVTFRVDTGFPKEGEPGSRFGYRTGIRKQDRENEKKDKDVINRAILAEGVDPNAPPERHRVAWNRLPALLAVDLWREYVSKFTLDELFKPTQPVPPPLQPLPQPTEQEIEPLSRPMHVSGIRETMLDSYTKMLHEVNRLMNNTIQWLEGKRGDQIRKPPPLPAASTTTSPPKTEPEKKTALQVINEMVQARLTQEEVDLLDDTGQRGHGTIKSKEHKLLQDRGLKVLSVGIFELRLGPQIEETIIRNWTASWLLNAKAESEQNERRRNLIESAGQEKAIRQYADLLSRDLIQRKPTGIKEALKMLLMRTRMIIFNNEQLRRRMSAEHEELEDIIKWVEGDAA
ncbi:MAG TPA: hypothetical protein VFO91_03510 [Anaerolineales bacterium]|nr:hypothetical protein [Anaerolineales bacterium]